MLEEKTISTDEAFKLSKLEVHFCIQPKPLVWVYDRLELQAISKNKKLVAASKTALGVFTVTSPRLSCYNLHFSSFTGRELIGSYEFLSEVKIAARARLKTLLISLVDGVTLLQSAEYNR